MLFYLLILRRMKYTLQRCEKRIFYGKNFTVGKMVFINVIYNKHIKDNAIPKFSNYETGIVHSVRIFKIYQYIENL